MVARNPLDIVFSFENGLAFTARLVDSEPVALEIPPGSGHVVPLAKIEPMLRNSRTISQVGPHRGPREEQRWAAS